MKIQLALAIAVVCLCVAHTGAQQHGGRLPSGSYSRTCNKAAMIGTILTAECKDQNGVTIVTRLYVLDCFGDISNEYGELVCSNRRLPPGSYSRTCTACTSEGSSLRCTCRDMKQNPIKTTLD